MFIEASLCMVIKVSSLQAQGLEAIFLLFIIFLIMYDYTIKGANDEKVKF